MGTHSEDGQAGGPCGEGERAEGPGSAGANSDGVRLGGGEVRPEKADPEGGRSEGWDSGDGYGDASASEDSHSRFAHPQNSRRPADSAPSPRHGSLTVLARSPSLTPLLALGALRSPFKRPAATADFPRTRLVLPGLRVDLARLAAYERVCGFATGEDALPVTYPHVLGFPLAMSLMSGRDFPLPLLGLVHTSIEITRYRALAATGEYELTVYVDGLAPHRRGTEAAVVTELRVGEEVVWESVSTYLARHRTKETDRERDRERHEPLPGVDEWRLAGDIGRRYAAASGDRNPIHLYPLTARLFGFPRAIAHGMWTAARCLAAHGTPQAVLVRAEFRAPVLLPGTVTYAADGERFELCGGDRVHVTGGVHSLA